ncbi:MAG: type III-B CRISPR module RAMP protein Cmr6, partial [Thermoguttaceae bacterium]
MTQAIRNNFLDVQNGDHAGLILCRYLVKHESGSGGKPSRDNLHVRAQTATQNAHTIYEKAFNRWDAAWKDRASKREFMLENRMIIGLGSDNVLEAGLTLHHTYGVPYIPGSAVKGLCSHYCHELGGKFANDYEREDNNKKKNVYTTLFGDTKQEGMIRFHDALIVPESVRNCLKDDVMTPHHGVYYQSEDETAPTDFDPPNPVTFLSVSGKFLFVISCDDLDGSGKVTPLGKKWIDFAWKLLGDALSNKGIGGKTNSGYGFGKLNELPEPPPRERQPGDRETLKRIRKEKGDLIFETSEENKSKRSICLVLKKDHPLAKKIPIETSVEMIYCGPLGDKLQFELTPELR